MRTKSTRFSSCSAIISADFAAYIRFGQSHFRKDSRGCRRSAALFLGPFAAFASFFRLFSVFLLFPACIFRKRDYIIFSFQDFILPVGVMVAQVILVHLV